VFKRAKAAIRGSTLAVKVAYDAGVFQVIERGESCVQRF
jgi:hypothetical protein